MDTTKKYIGMCREARDIQSNWDSKIGRYFNSCMGGVCIYTGRLHASGWTFEVICENDIEGRHIWLPRQDELQEMLDKPKKWADSAFDMLCSIYDFSQDWVGGGAETMGLNDFGEYLEKFSSAEQVWLAFVMKEKYNKTWDGKEWINGQRPP